MERRRRYYARFGLPIDGGLVPLFREGRLQRRRSARSEASGPPVESEAQPRSGVGVPGPFRDVPKRVGAAQWDFSLSYLSHLLNQALGVSEFDALFLIEQAGD